MALPAGWILPEWPVPPGVLAVCSTRAGGVSHAPYGSLNLGDHVGDDPGAVSTNRSRFASALCAKPVFMKQVHGTQVLDLARGSVDGVEADGCFADQPGLVCTIMVADCLPILFAAADGRAVAAAHAGWRGLAGQGGRGIVESVWERFQFASGSPAPRTLVWLGPCIGPAAFEVGPDVKAAFEATDPESAVLFKPQADGKWLADLPGLARRRLQSLGLSRIYGNDGSRAWCTVSNPSRFFSHRRDRVSGRFAASAWLA
ncbi:MAG: peptidoglycan editing factor PgeF [Ramlibacter sp.]